MFNLQGISFSEIAALLTIATLLGGGLAWLIRQHHLSTFLTKRAYYAQRDEDKKAAEKAATAALTEQGNLLAKLEEVNTNLSELMLKLAEWRGELDKRISVLEDRGRRPHRGSGR